MVNKGSVCTLAAILFFSSTVPANAVNTKQYKSYAKNYMLNKYNWDSKQFSCLSKLWQRESHWNPKAHNTKSGAYGIPQALPGKKMGKGWKTNAHVQIRWGLKYIKNRYKTPCNAWSSFNKKGWY